MAQAIKKNFSAPDEVRTMSGGRVEIVELGDTLAMRLTAEPGWKWSEMVKPVVKTDSCQVHHIGYQVAGHLRVRMDDGSEVVYGPGDAYNIPPGHDAWVEGNETLVSIDFRGGQSYAKPQQ